MKSRVQDMITRVVEGEDPRVVLHEAGVPSKMTVKLPSKRDTMIMADQLSGYYGHRGQTKRPTDALSYKVDIFPVNSTEVRVTITPPTEGGASGSPPMKVTGGIKDIIKNMILTWSMD